MFKGRIGATKFTSLAELQATTTEVHAVQLDPAIFAAGVTVPAAPFPGLPPADLRLNDGSLAIDAGLAIPNINDGHAGAAPDLGAHELGDPLPVYGPRS